MELRKEILREHTKTNTMKIVKYIGNDVSRFKNLMHLFLKGEYRITQRSSWIVSYCSISNPDFIKPYFKQMISKLREKNIHDAVKRNTVKIWSEIPIPEKYNGEIYEICYSFLHSIEEPLAIKVHSMSVLEKISRKYPDLRKELKITIEEMIPFGKPAIVARGKKVLKLLGKKLIEKY